MTVFVNSISFNNSFVDGPGVRSVIFLQGCTLHCDGCHNKSTWKTNCGIESEVSELAKLLVEKVVNKKITISGGEPLFQYQAVLELVKCLEGFDLCLYTGSEFEEVLRDCSEILPYLHYIKVGKYKKELRTTTIPFIGSSNQKFLTLKDGKIDE